MTSLFNPNSRPAKAPGCAGSGESGASLVEITLLMPVLMLILFGMVDLGRYVFLAIEVSGAARAGAQYGAQSQTTYTDTTGITAAARNDVLADISSSVSVTPSTATCLCVTNSGVTTVSCGTSCSGGLIHLMQVNTSYTYSPWIPYPPFTASFTIRGTATIPVGQQF